MNQYKLLINGNLVSGASTVDVINPSTERLLASAPSASAEQVKEAVEAAAAAFTLWAETSISKRAQVLENIASLIEKNSEELTRLLCQETGMPITFAGYEVIGLANIFRYFSGLSINTKTIEESTTRIARLVRKPLGVVAAILPWNFPFGQLGAKAAPALLAGNTLVIKPAGTTPLATLRLGEIIADAVPAGVINIISDNNDMGGVLSGHPKIRKVSFTGSTSVGKRIMAGAAEDLKRVTLELGGNDAAIVLEDADPEQIAEALFMSAFYHSGQICCGIKRLYVHDKLYDSIAQKLADLAISASVGDSESNETVFGPLQNKAQYDRVVGYLNVAQRDGVVIAGGHVLERKGYFIPPTIVRDISEASALVQEEQFGPILPILRFSHEEEVLQRANASPYGLGGSVWSSDVNRARALATRLEVGNAWINKHADTGPAIAFCGAKSSGLGVEMGEEGLFEFTQVQVVNEPGLAS